MWCRLGERFLYIETMSVDFASSFPVIRAPWRRLKVVNESEQMTRSCSSTKCTASCTLTCLWLDKPFSAFWVTCLTPPKFPLCVLNWNKSGLVVSRKCIYLQIVNKYQIFTAHLVIKSWMASFSWRLVWWRFPVYATTYLQTSSISPISGKLGFEKYNNNLMSQLARHAFSKVRLCWTTRFDHLRIIRNCLIPLLSFIMVDFSEKGEWTGESKDLE